MEVIKKFFTCNNREYEIFSLYKSATKPVPASVVVSLFALCSEGPSLYLGNGDLKNCLEDGIHLLKSARVFVLCTNRWHYCGEMYLRKSTEITCGADTFQTKHYTKSSLKLNNRHQHAWIRPCSIVL